MKGYIFEIQDKDIVNILHRVYITEDFKNNLEYLIKQFNIYNNEYNIKFLGINILKIIHLVLIDNIYRYLATNQYNLLLNLLQNKTIQNDIVIRRFYIYDLLEEIKKNIIFTIYNNDYDNYDKYYNILERFLYKIISDIFYKEEYIYTELFKLMNTLLSKVTIFKENIIILSISNQLLFLDLSE